jgi:RNA polymerase sigma-70 factor, ECF subfamily
MPTSHSTLPTPLERYRQYLSLLADLQIDPRVRHRIDPADVVQQTFLEAHQKLGQLRGTSTGELAGWLRQILAHNLADAVRAIHRDKRDARRERSLEQEVARTLDQTSARLEAWVVAEQSSPSQRAMRHERAVALADALAALPEPQRQALVLQYWHGWSLAQIATHLEKTPAAVAGLLKRGLAKLRETLAEGTHS